MSYTFHIKRYREYLDTDADPRYLNRLAEAAHDDLAHHLELEHERNNQLQEQLDVLHRSTFKAYSDIATLEKRIEELNEMVTSHRHDDGTGSLSCTASFQGSDLPKGENN